MPNQYVRVKNAVKGEDDIQDQPPTYGFIDEFLEDAIKNSNLYEEQDTDYEHNIYTSLSINNTLHNKCMSLPFLPENHHISFLDGGANTCVLGKGWKILSMHNSRRANVVGFDDEAAVKKNLPRLLVPLLHWTYPIDNQYYQSFMKQSTMTLLITHYCQSFNLENMEY
jgi:hypothetical protein